MQRILPRLTSFDLIASCSFLQRSYVTDKWNHVAYSRNVDLGKQVYEASAVRSIIELYPEWDTSTVNDVVQGLALNNGIRDKIQTIDALKSVEDTKGVFSVLGKLTLNDEVEQLNEILQEIRLTCLSDMSLVDASLLVKKQHPKAILKEFIQIEQVNILLETKKVEGIYEATIYHNGELLSSAKHEKRAEAERMVCLETLVQMFPKMLEQFDVTTYNFPLEADVHLGSVANRERTVCLKKSAEESFGFTIRGGERKGIRNNDYIHLDIITPVFISHIEKGSPADRCGLRVGDCLLAVNDHLLKDNTHKQAVTSLSRFTDQQLVNFIVVYSKEEKLKYEAQQTILEREKEKIRVEIESDRMGRWHHAKSKTDPEEYFLEKFQHKKRPFGHHKARKSIRLWDYPYKK